MRVFSAQVPALWACQMSCGRVGRWESQRQGQRRHRPPTHPDTQASKHPPITHLHSAHAVSDFALLAVGANWVDGWVSSGSDTETEKAPPTHPSTRPPTHPPNQSTHHPSTRLTSEHDSGVVAPPNVGRSLGGGARVHHPPTTSGVLAIESQGNGTGAQNPVRSRGMGTSQRRGACITPARSLAGLHGCLRACARGAEQ